MYRLVDDMARVRRLYRRPLPTLPDLLLIDVPPSFASPALPLGRYYPVIIESPEEAIEFDAFLSQPRAAPIVPDLFDRRPTALRTERITFATYAPDDSRWPFLLLCHWPARFTAFTTDPMMFARTAYTVEVFDTEPDLYRAADQLLAVLGADAPVTISTIPPVRDLPGTA